MKAERTIKFDEEEPISVDAATWMSIYRRLQNMNPADTGARKIAMTSKTPSHSTPGRMVDRTFEVNDKVARSTKIALGNLARQTKRRA